jgi:hypothetical protein
MRTQKEEIGGDHLSTHDGREEAGYQQEGGVGAGVAQLKIGLSARAEEVKEDAVTCKERGENGDKRKWWRAASPPGPPSAAGSGYTA